MSSEQRRDWMKEYALVPPNIPLGGSGSFIFTTAEGLAALHEFGRRWRNENPQRQRILGEDKALARHFEGQTVRRRVRQLSIRCENRAVQPELGSV
jgi:hypothetical protein